MSFRDTENLSMPLGRLLIVEEGRIRVSQSRWLACLEAGKASVQRVVTEILAGS